MKRFHSSCTAAGGGRAACGPDFDREDPPELGRVELLPDTLEGSFSAVSQPNMRLKALDEIYTMHSFAQLCNLNFLSIFFHKNLPNFAKFSKISKLSEKFRKIVSKI